MFIRSVLQISELVIQSKLTFQTLVQTHLLIAHGVFVLQRTGKSKQMSPGKWSCSTRCRKVLKCVIKVLVLSVQLPLCEKSSFPSPESHWKLLELNILLPLFFFTPGTCIIHIHPSIRFACACSCIQDIRCFLY